MKNIFIIICAVALFCTSLKGAESGTLERGIAAFKSEDYSLALKIIKPLAIQGGATAQFYLGKMFDNGAGITEDNKKAVEWYRKAANQGYTKAQNNLGNMYDNGEGVAENAEEATRKWSWFVFRALKGDPEEEKEKEEEKEEDGQGRALSSS